MAESKRETALIIPVPAAEPAVGGWRQRFDPSAATDIPAHITLLYPFRAPDQIDEALLAELRALFAAVAPIRFSLAGICGFRGVIYLAPEPAGPFDHLIATLMVSYPDLIPYGGTVADPIPHLTVAQLEDAELLDRVLREFAEASLSALPVETVADEVHLMEEMEDGRWRTRVALPLGR
ncbi:MAG: 2'-5' RNA ligase family protein [Dehalococcoidia bacterium]